MKVQNTQAVSIASTSMKSSQWSLTLGIQTKESQAIQPTVQTLQISAKSASTSPMEANALQAKKTMLRITHKSVKQQKMPDSKSKTVWSSSSSTAQDPLSSSLWTKAGMTCLSELVST